MLSKGLLTSTSPYPKLYHQMGTRFVLRRGHPAISYRRVGTGSHHVALHAYIWLAAIYAWRLIFQHPF